MAEDKLVHVFASLDILQEINRVLAYDKIVGILRRSQTVPSSIMVTIVSLCSVIDVKAKIHIIREDPSDNSVLACAKEAGAHFIVTGDRHLLQLGQHRKAMILTPSKFLETQKATEEEMRKAAQGIDRLRSSDRRRGWSGAKEIRRWRDATKSP